MADDLADELDHIRDCIEIASELPMTADPRRIVDIQAPRLLAAVRAVLKEHRPDHDETPFCAECGHAWPCITYRAITGELTGKGGSNGG